LRLRAQPDLVAEVADIAGLRVDARIGLRGHRIAHLEQVRRTGQRQVEHPATKPR
jgi:hypothetical protein